MNQFLFGIAFAVEVSLGTLILIGLFKNVWVTAVGHKGLFWALGWSAYAMAFTSFIRAMGDTSPIFELTAGVAQILFHSFVLSYVGIFLVGHWRDES